MSTTPTEAIFISRQTRALSSCQSRPRSGVLLDMTLQWPLNGTSSSGDMLRCRGVVGSLHPARVCEGLLCSTQLFVTVFPFSAVLHIVLAGLHGLCRYHTQDVWQHLIGRSYVFPVCTCLSTTLFSFHPEELPVAIYGERCDHVDLTTRPYRRSGNGNKHLSSSAKSPRPVTAKLYSSCALLFSWCSFVDSF